MAERSNAAVLKTVEVKASGGSNPSLSATQGRRTSPFLRGGERGYAETPRFARGGNMRRCPAEGSHWETAEYLFENSLPHNAKGDERLPFCIVKLNSRRRKKF